MRYFFTADEHYSHRNIILYCGRPFASVEEMNAEIVRRHNEVVKPEDTVIHAGDFALASKSKVEEVIRQLNGRHVFLMGSHDRWLKGAPNIWEGNVSGHWIVACHYAMRTWPKSHYGSWNVHGHSHGKLQPIGKQWDVGVDNNDFYPVSFDKLNVIMASRPENANRVPLLEEERDFL
jgi:calcineurin-like phosphoesterase family protein